MNIYFRIECTTCGTLQELRANGGGLCHLWWSPVKQDSRTHTHLVSEDRTTSGRANEALLKVLTTTETSGATVPSPTVMAIEMYGY